MPWKEDGLWNQVDPDFVLFFYYFLNLVMLKESDCEQQGEVEGERERESQADSS